jgi:hypothetical protein
MRHFFTLPRCAALFAVLLVAAVLLAPLPQSWHGPWQSKFFDLGHVPLFAALTLVLWQTLGRRWPWPALIALAIAALAEVVQDHFGRTGNVEDFVRGALGVAAAVVLVHAWRRPRTWTRLAVCGLLLVALLTWPIADCGPYLLDAAEGHAAYPTLADFATERQLLRWRCQQSELTRQGDGAARLDLLPGPESYPGATLRPIVRDWSGRRRVCCTFTVIDRPLVVVCSLRSGPAHSSTHYQFEKSYPPGEHHICADLATVAPLARPEPLDLTRVEAFQLFTYRPAEPRTILLHRVWVE